MNIPNMRKIVDVQSAKLRRPVPSRWEAIRNGQFPQSLFLVEPGGLRVMLTTDVMQDGSRWLHVSVSRETKLPSWDDLKTVKDEFVGRANEAIQVLPADRDYVNLHQFCLHLWSPDP